MDTDDHPLAEDGSEILRADIEAYVRGTYPTATSALIYASLDWAGTRVELLAVQLGDGTEVTDPEDYDLDFGAVRDAVSPALGELHRLEPFKLAFTDNVIDESDGLTVMEF